jgi:OOP family OmpA-OmpF porin
MKKLYILISAFCLFAAAQAQPGKSKKKGQVVGVSFTMHDFGTVSDFQKSSLSAILESGSWAKSRNMSPGFALSYSQGIFDNLDVMVRMGMTSLDYPRPGNRVPNASTQKTLIESDVSFQAKMLSDAYLVSPYISLGAGASAWDGYYSAYAPVGLGLQMNLFDEVYLNFQAQYRLPVSGDATRHIFYGIGMGSTLGKKK